MNIQPYPQECAPSWSPWRWRIPAGAATADPSADPLTAEIARWSVFLKNNTSTDEFWVQVRERQRADPRARRQRRCTTAVAGWRCSVSPPCAVNLAASESLERRSPGSARTTRASRRKWARLGKALKADLRGPSAVLWTACAPAPCGPWARRPSPGARLLRVESRVRAQHHARTSVSSTWRRAGAEGVRGLLPLPCGADAGAAAEAARACSGRSTPCSAISSPSTGRRCRSTGTASSSSPTPP